MADNEVGGSTIVIKRIKKNHGAAHGGAWKVAYADFVTAMMAFFLLLWLLNAVTEEQLSGISDYFAPTTVSQSTSGAGGVLGGQVLGDGSSTSQSSNVSAPTSLPPPTIGKGGQDYTDPQEQQSPNENQSDFQSQQQIQQEQAQFDQAMEKLQQAIQSLPDAAQLSKSMLVDNTLEGLRIQLVDQEGVAMFASASSQMQPHLVKLIELVARVIDRMPQKIAISGHTDATPFPVGHGMTNWELSADRALASRRVLLAAGIAEDRIDRVVGKAATEPLLKDDPTAPRNRRIAIVLLREADLNGAKEINANDLGGGTPPPLFQ